MDGNIAGSIKLSLSIKGSGSCYYNNRVDLGEALNLLTVRPLVL